MNDKLHILIVNSDQSVSTPVKEFLQKSGMMVSTVRTHEEASAYLANSNGHSDNDKPDLILLNQSNGTTCNGRMFLIRGLNRGVPAIGFAESDSANNVLMEAGAVKSFNCREITEQINRGDIGAQISFLETLQDTASQGKSAAR